MLKVIFSLSDIRIKTLLFRIVFLKGSKEPLLVDG